MPSTSELGQIDQNELYPGFTNTESILSQEWLELPEEQLHIGGFENVHFDVTSPFLSTQGDESWGDLFRVPGGPGMP